MTRSWRHQPKPAGPVSDIEAVLRRRIPDYDTKVADVRAAVIASELIRRMRARARLSQTQLAQRLHLSQARVSEIESVRGAQGPTFDLILRIATACAVHLRLDIESTAPEAAVEEHSLDAPSLES